MPRLTSEQERVARWLGRAGKVSLRQAEQHGISKETLEAVVSAGRAERGEEQDPIYRPVEVGAKWSSGGQPTGPAREAPQPTTTPVAQLIVDLMKDGEFRTAGDIAKALSADNFTASQQIARQIQKLLPELTQRGFLQRIFLGGEGRFRHDERYVDASTVLPVCQLCFKGFWGRDAVPPQATGNPVRLCSVCGRRTNDPCYVPTKDVHEKTEKK